MVWKWSKGERMDYVDNKRNGHSTSWSKIDCDYVDGIKMNIILV